MAKSGPMARLTEHSVSSARSRSSSPGPSSRRMSGCSTAELKPASCMRGSRSCGAARAGRPGDRHTAPTRERLHRACAPFPGHARRHIASCWHPTTLCVWCRRHAPAKAAPTCMVASVSSCIASGSPLPPGTISRLSAGSSSCRWSSNTGPRARIASSAGFTCAARGAGGGQPRQLARQGRLHPAVRFQTRWCRAGTPDRSPHAHRTARPRRPPPPPTRFLDSAARRAHQREVGGALRLVQQRHKSRQQLGHVGAEVVAQRLCRRARWGRSDPGTSSRGGETARVPAGTQAPCRQHAQAWVQASTSSSARPWV